MDTASIISCVGIIGTLVGVWLGSQATRKASEKAAEAQMDSTALSVFLNARLEAYKEFERALAALAVSTTPDSIADVYRAENSLCFIASAKTVHYAATLCEMIRESQKSGVAINYDAFHPLHSKVLSSMQNDLLSYPEIRKSGNHSKKSLLQERRQQ